MCDVNGCKNNAKVIAQPAHGNEVEFCFDCWRVHQNDAGMEYVEFVDARRERIMQDKMMGGR